MNVPNRHEIETRYKWVLSHIVVDDETWESDFNALKKETDGLIRYRGKLNEREKLLACLKKKSEVACRFYRLAAYAHMNSDIDVRDEKYKDMRARCEMLSVKMSSANSFIVPEILKMSVEKIKELAGQNEFGDFSYYLEELARQKPHILSECEEKILSETGRFSGAFHDAFSMFDNADVRFKLVKDADGEKIEMSHANYALLLQSQDRRVRKAAFSSMFTAFSDMNNTLAEIYGGEVRLNVFYAKVRRYGSALERALANENVSPRVYRNLVAVVNRNLNGLHEYMEFRRRLMNLSKLHMYDMHVSLVENENIEVSYEEAYDLVKKALLPLGGEYAELLTRAYSDGWIDVFENKGKRSGAYSGDAYGVHPYVLLNYKSTTHDVFTIAHELGHAMHTYFSNREQPFEKADYTIFVAEVASTVNEVLLLKYLLKTATGKSRQFLLSYYLDMFRTTVFRQTQFAEFEELTHAAAENDTALTPEVLNGMYLKLNKKYYGQAVVSDKLIAREWSRIPHFYRAFYVYKYATGFCSAVVIANRIALGDVAARDAYFKFLSAGGSEDPISVLRLAGVDMEKETALEDAFLEFNATLSELKKEMLAK